MRYLFLYCFFFCAPLWLHGQKTVYEDQTWNFGDVAFWNNDTAWFEVKNATDKNMVFLPIYYNDQFKVLFSNRAINPGEIVKIGIVYYTEKKGKFDVEVPLYVNVRGQPIKFHLKGNIKSFDPMAQLRCPTVNTGTTENRREKVITIEVRDRATDAVLEPDLIYVRDKDNSKIKLEKSNTEFEMSVLPGTYKVGATKVGYDNYFAIIMLEPYQQKFIVYLDKTNVVDPWPDNHPVVTVPVIINKTPDTDVDTANKISVVEIHPHGDSTVTPAKPIAGTLDVRVYKFNNVILIVDVSSSMNRSGKLDQLKSSFNYLVDALRGEDKVAVISMSSAAEVVQPPVGVYEKDSLKSKMASMKATGGTNGGAALEMAYKLAKLNFVPDGNNQIIIATDGIFYGGSMGRRDMERLIAEGNKEGIHLSTVAFGSDPKALMFLENLAAIGGGTAVQVNAGSDGTQLLDMIKTQSRKD